MYRTDETGNARQLARPARPAPAPADERIALSEVVSALSFALDLTEDAVPGHAVRCCLLGMRIGMALGLDGQQLSDLYYALLLKDIGCSSNAARMCQILGADERQAKRDVKTLDWTRPSLAAVKLAWKNALPRAGYWRKMQRVAWLGFSQHRHNAEMIGLRCDRGADIVRKIGMAEPCAEAIHALDEHWNGSGYPDRARGNAIPLLAQILAIAQHLDVFANELGRAQALETLIDRSGTWFNPRLVQLAVLLHREGTLWTGYGTPEERSLAIGMEPGPARTLASAQIDSLCEAFADVVDTKSSFTYRHSLGVTGVADELARQLGVAPEKRKLIHRAALLHDLGKLRVPNSILDKPGKLDQAEWAVMREHPLLSQQILERISSFGPIARIAGRHHEKLDGTGYPHQLKGEDLSLEDRIVAMADFYGALTEDRPYRPALPIGGVLALLRKEVPRKLDPECFAALLSIEDLQTPETLAAPSAPNEATLPDEPLQLASAASR